MQQGTFTGPRSTYNRNNLSLTYVNINTLKYPKATVTFGNVFSHNHRFEGREICFC